MLKILYQSFMCTLCLTILLCGVYPLVVTGIGKALFSNQANGSLIQNASGVVMGSKLIGQSFTKPEYFHGRPSSAGNGYDAANSSGSNLAVSNPKFIDGLNANIVAVMKENPTLQKGSVPNELVMASGSGLDPHLSPYGMEVQVDRVSKARGVSAVQIQTLINTHTEGPTFGLFGESVVNVLEVNLDLDKNYPIKGEK